MIYPAFLRTGDTVGITAPSAGIRTSDLAGFDLSLSRIAAAGYRLCETANVRKEGAVSSTAAERAQQLNALFHDRDIRMIWCAAGGDFLADMLPFVDFDAAAEDPKWVQGYSDPTSLLYALTTTRDIATVYGVNAGGFDTADLHEWQRYSLALPSGTLPVQHSFAAYHREIQGKTEEHPVVWETPHGEVHAAGRLLGGCLECLYHILGTRFDGTADFLRRYRGDGILWYFDIFSTTAEEVYLALWHMRELGWFDGTVGVMFGRVCFPGSFLDMSYREAICAALPDLPLVLEADVGHVPPRMTLINGALATLDAADGHGTLSMKLI